MTLKKEVFMRIYDIKWDVVDSDNTIEEEQYLLFTLPKEVIIPDPDDVKEIDRDLYIKDYLYDEYGYYVDSYKV